jgi:hypothetical protein
MRSPVFVLVFIGLLVACTNKPAYVLSDKKMENILFDLYLAEVEVQENALVFNNDSAKKQHLLQSVFNKHKVSRAKFDTSLVWYNAHINRYLEINELVAARCGQLIGELEAEIKQQARGLLQDTVRFEDLEYIHYILPDTLFHWLPKQAADSIPQDTLSIPEKISYFCVEYP